MPIRPENRARYPKNWAEVRRRIMERAGNRCEWVTEDEAAETTTRCAAIHGGRHPETRAIVVLTIAHLDHTPENCADGNLRAWCQLHHNRYDAKHRAQTRRRTRDDSTGQEGLFGGAQP